jgi:hypothetical protein
MRLWLLVGVVSWVADGVAWADDGAGPRSVDCAALLDALRADLRDAEAHPVVLRTAAVVASRGEDDGEPCPDFARARQALRSHGGAGIERGLLADRRAAGWSEGPQGSGHYWSIALAIAGRAEPIGACLTASTSGWRNLSREGRRLIGPWRMLVGGRFHLRSTLVAGATEWESLLLPIVYRLSDDTLVVDRARTAAEIGRFGWVYERLWPMPDDPASVMHHAAADAYRAFAADRECK